MEKCVTKLNWESISNLLILLALTVFSLLWGNSFVNSATIDMLTYLDGSQESGVVSSARGVGRFTVDTIANTLNYNISFGGLSSAETAAHIHGPALIGSSSGPLTSLPSGNPKTGVWNYPEALEGDILSGLTYVNIHSTNYSGGEIRGQIVNLVAVLDASQESGSIISSATGIGLFSIDTDANSLNYYVKFAGLSSGETGAHIHGPASISSASGVLSALPLGSPKTGTWNYPEALENDILSGLTYVNIHTTTNPGGEIRGQIVNNLSAIDDQQESPATNTGAFGVGAFSLDRVANELGYHITFSGLSSAETAAHIHGFASRGNPAAPVHTLPAGSPKVGKWTYNPGDEANIESGLTYVNVHSVNHAGGEIRGQIEPPTNPTTEVGMWDLY